MGKNETVPNKEAHMTSIAASAVSIHTSSQSVPSAPCWLGEVTLVVQHLRQQGVLDAITQQVRFARRRFGHYEVIDFLAVLFGYAISGERTLEAFYERLAPCSLPDTLKMRGKSERKQRAKQRAESPRERPEEQPERKGVRPFKQ
jgi:hypothetical protein